MSSRLKRTRTGIAVLVGKRARDLGHYRVGLAAECSSVRNGRCGLAAGFAPRSVGFKIGGLDKGRRSERARPSDGSSSGQLTLAPELRP